MKYSLHYEWGKDFNRLRKAKFTFRIYCQTILRICGAGELFKEQLHTIYQTFRYLREHAKITKGNNSNIYVHMFQYTKTGNKIYRNILLSNHRFININSNFNIVRKPELIMRVVSENYVLYLNKVVMLFKVTKKTVSTVDSPVRNRRLHTFSCSQVMEGREENMMKIWQGF